MTRVFRQDAITLQSEAREEDLERFVLEELIPYFSERYRGPTRASIADLESQTFLRDAKDRRKYVWVTVWRGSPESLRDQFFEGARMTGGMEETRMMLKKLDRFGERTIEGVLLELVYVEVATNK